MRRFSLPVEQTESGLTTLPFAHVITEFRPKDPRDNLSDSYHSQKYLPPGDPAPVTRGWLGNYIEAGPVYQANYIPRVYRTGTLGLLVPPHQKAHDSDTLRFEVSRFECGFPRTTATQGYDSVFNVHLNSVCNLATMYAPLFSATATVRLLMDPAPKADRQHWSIGWVQGCLSYRSYCSYDNGGSVNYDLLCYGVRTGTLEAPPWYGAGSVLHLKDLKNNEAEQPHVLQLTSESERTSKAFPMAFYDGIEFCREPDSHANPPFKHMHWSQKYRAWLVLRENNSGSLFVLRSVTWSTEVHYHPPSRRVTYVDTKAEVDKWNFFIPEATLRPETMSDHLQAVYHHKAWGDIKYAQIRAHRPPTNAARAGSLSQQVSSTLSDLHGVNLPPHQS